MKVDKKTFSGQVSSDDTQALVPEIALHHGQALWLLSELGFRGDAAQSTFYEYIKSLRKIGIPFEVGKIGRAHRGLANYSYHHLMELALALTLRVYHVVPDSVLIGIIEHREVLNRQYYKAYSERCTGTGAPVVFKTDGFSPIQVRGVFLDLQVNFSGGRLVRLGPPRVLSPFEAVSAFVQRDLAARALLPIGLSVLSERVVALALRAPSIRRGPRPTTRPAAKRSGSQSPPRYNAS